MPVRSHASIPAVEGYTAFTTFYTGNSWAFDPALNQHYITELPNFRSEFSSGICPNPGITARGYRQVSIDGQFYEVLGSVGTVNPK